MRLFVGVPVPGEVGRELLGAVRREGGMRALLPEDLHVTLVFLGEVEDGRAAELERLLDEVRWEPFEARVNGRLAAFGNALVVEAERGAELVGLQERVKRRLDEAAFPSEERAYRPHVTLGRGRGRSVRVPEGGVSAWAWEVERFVLYRSRGGGEGPRYECVRSVALRQG